MEGSIFTRIHEPKVHEEKRKGEKPRKA